MTTMTEMTLWHFFFDGQQGDSKGAHRIGDEHVAEVRTRLGADLPVGLEAGFRSSLDDGLKGVLSTSLGDVVAGGWNHYRELRRARDPKEHPPDEIVTVQIGEHSISSSHRPQLVVTMNGAALGPPVEFEVELRLDLTAATLKVQGGEIREIRAGQCVGTGTLRCGPALLAERRSRAVTLPGVITLHQSDAAAAGA